jgi:hypothetical protein
MPTHAPGEDHDGGSRVHTSYSGPPEARMERVVKSCACGHVHSDVTRPVPQYDEKGNPK